MGALHPLQDRALPSLQTPSPTASTAVEERKLGEELHLGRERVGSVNPGTPPRAAPWCLPILGRIECPHILLLSPEPHVTVFGGGACGRDRG